MLANDPEQLLALSAGLKKGGYPTEQTRERAISTATYSFDHPLLAVTFSGKCSFFTPELDSGEPEAQVMAEIAVDNGLDERLVRIERDSKTTLRNFLNSRFILIPDKAVGVVVHGWQEPLAQLIGGKVLSQDLGFVIVDADNPRVRSLEATIEYMATVALLAGIEPGDAEAVEARSDQAERLASKFGPTFKSLMTKLHPAFK